MQWKSSLGLTWIIKNLKGISESGKKEKMVDEKWLYNTYSRVGKNPWIPAWPLGKQLSHFGHFAFPGHFLRSS